MADNTTTNAGTGGDTIATDELTTINGAASSGVKVQRVKIGFGVDGDFKDVSNADRLPVTGTFWQATQPVSFTWVGLTDAQLRATPVAVSGTFWQATQPVSGTFWQATQPVSIASWGGLTDAQLRASAVPVSGTFWQATQPVSFTWAGLTDAQLRATAVPVSGPLTDAQLRAANVNTKVAAYNYPISTGNSSTTQLAAGASFTGAIETAQDQPSLSILLTSDQPTTVRVRQFIDAGGTFAAPDIFFYVDAGVGFARSLTINGNYVQVIAQNTGASTTTTFNLNCAYGSLGDADSAGTQPVTELPLVLTGAAAQTATVNNILTPAAGTAGLSVAGYRSASVQVVSTGTGGTFIFEQSNTGGAAANEWRPLPVFNAELVNGTPITAAITATASQIIYTFAVRAVFLRLRIATTITGGSIRAFSRISTEPWTAAAQLVASNTAGNMQVTADTEFAAAAALADAAANPTTASGGALQSGFNGTTWDRARNNHNVAVEASSAKVASGNGSTQTNFNASGLFVWVNVTAVSGTTPTLTVRVQWSPDGGTTWLDLDTTNAQTASITGVTAAVLRIYPGIATAANAALNAPLPRTWRLAWTVGGTTPSFTFAAQASYIL